MTDQTQSSAAQPPDVYELISQIVGREISEQEREWLSGIFDGPTPTYTQREATTWPVVCDLCGCVVGVPATHDEWHRRWRNVR